MQVAVLDDDIHQLDLLSHAVQALGYACHRFSTGAGLLHALQQASFDLFLIDWELPDMPGLDVLRTLRLGHRTQSPVIFVTQRDDERDVVQALSAGADDYVVKPVRSAELKARVLALLRRAYPSDAATGLRHGDFLLQPSSHSVYYQGHPVVLKQREFDLALFLFQNIGRLLSRKHLLEAVWGIEAEVSSRSLDTHVSRLRTKLGLHPEHGFRLAAIYSVGYRLEGTAATPNPDSAALDGAPAGDPANDAAA